MSADTFEPGPTRHVRPRASGVIQGVAWYVEQHSKTPCLVVTLSGGPPAALFWQGPLPPTVTQATAPAHCATLIEAWFVKAMSSVAIPEGAA